MEIIVAEPTGFCSGVQKAISGSLALLSHNTTLYCLGDIIHNHGVVHDLQNRGMIFTSDVADIPKGVPFIIRSHGLPYNTIKQIQEKQCTIHDFTCPRVKKTHHLVKRLTKQKKQIVIVGNPAHPEVRALYSLTSNNAVIIDSTEDVAAKISFQECHIVVQTTFNPEQFLHITEEIIRIVKKVTVHNTLCEETIKRQQEAVKLAERVDLIVVVGGKHSSNTKTLFTIVKNKVTAYHIENAAELQKMWFRSCKIVAIISGASTPESEVSRVYEKISNFNVKSVV